MNYEEKEFRSVSSGDLGIEEEDKEEVEKETSENKELFAYMKEILADKVKDVRASKRLRTHPVCLTTEGQVSIEMEKVLQSMPDNQNIQADKVLELKVDHDVFESLKTAFTEDKDKVKLYTNLLYNQAFLIEGLPVNDPVEFTNDICKVMVLIVPPFDKKINRACGMAIYRARFLYRVCYGYSSKSIIRSGRSVRIPSAPRSSNSFIVSSSLMVQ